MMTYFCCRFVAIVYPLRARSVCTVRHARVVIGVIWTLSCVLSAPVLYIQASSLFIIPLCPRPVRDQFNIHKSTLAASIALHIPAARLM